MSESPQRYRVWDAPSRLSHWAITLLLLAQFASGQFGLLPMSVHVWMGYALLAVVLFRVLWGFVGSESARFTHFLRGLGAALRYLRTLSQPQPSHWAGHNPVGGWSIVLMLALMLAQAGTGLFADDRGDVRGPLAERVAPETARMLTEIHGLLHWPLLLIVLAHVAASIYYRVHKRENRIGAIFGDGSLELRTDPAVRFAGPVRALAVLAISVTAVAAIVVYGPV